MGQMNPKAGENVTEVHRNHKIMKSHKVRIDLQEEKLGTNTRGWYYFIEQFSSVTLSCPTLCDPMDCSMSGFPVPHQLRELAQTHIHRVGDTIQPSHPLLSPSPPAFNLSQHQGLFQ